VGESVEKPLEYYDNNVNGTLTLLLVMRATGVRQIVFSSSATVYGNPATVRSGKTFRFRPPNPYGRSKLIIEDVLRDSCWRMTRGKSPCCATSTPSVHTKAA